MPALSSALRSLKHVFWPVAAPVSADPARSAAAGAWWRLLCILCVLPATAFLHHGVFMRPTCILNAFGAEYTWETISAWIVRDPSPSWAVLGVLAMFWL